MKSSSLCEENSELEYPTSSENGVDTRRGEYSLDSSRTISEISTYSEPSSSDELQLRWPVSQASTVKQHSDLPNLKTGVYEVPNSVIQLTKERFSKLLLGEDMSGSGTGVCTAVAISNAITNLFATIFGQFWRLEPLSAEKKAMWRREMECRLSVCDYIVEFYPSLITLPDGRTLEVMESRLRSDIYSNLPALEKLDGMLIEILDSFEKTEFWYVDDEGQSSQGSVASSMSRSFRRASHRKEEMWWLPVPCVPDYGLQNISRSELKRKRELASQIHKAAMAVNSSILADMAVPDSYYAALPKSGRKSLRDPIYRYMSTPHKFSPDYLLNCLHITTEHEALELADHVEAAMYVWRRKASTGNLKSSWAKVKDLMTHENWNMILASRAESLLLCLKQRYPGLSQTTLDMCKIQYNRDVGQAVLESYSRVLEGLAFNIVAWINDVLYIDGSVKKQ